MEKVRFATVGTSAITQKFLRAAATCPAFVYAAAYSRSVEHAREFGEPRGAGLFFDSLDALAASPEVDAVYVASPNSLHPEQAMRLVRAGKHVLVEKAFASNERQAREVFDAAHSAGVVAMEAMRSLHDPGFAVIQETLPELGTVRDVSFRFAKVSSRAALLSKGELPTVFDPRLAAGALMDIGIYAVEPVIALFGAPSRVQVAGVVVDAPTIPASEPCHLVDLSGQALLQYPDKVASVSWGKVSDDHLSSQIQGERATLLVGKASDPRDVRLVTPVDTGAAYGTGEGEEHRLDVPNLENNMGCELADFISAITGEGTPILSAEAAEKVTLSSLALMDEIRRQLGVVFPSDLA